MFAQWARVLAFGISFSVTPAASHAEEPSALTPQSSGFDMPVDITATTAAGFRSDRKYGEIFGRLNLAGQLTPWQLALRLDTATFLDEPDEDISDNYTLEKASARWTNRTLDITIGDSYVSFGRGLGLSLRKLDEFGIDTTLRGAKVLAHHGPFVGTLAAGYANVNNVDEATGTSVDDPYDLIAGAQAQLMLGEVNLGGYGSMIAFHNALGLVPLDRYSDRSTQFGVTIGAPQLHRRVRVYLEGTGQRLVSGPAGEEDLGFGMYAVVTGYFGNVTVLLESKAYGDLTPLAPNLGNPAFAGVLYQSPPTVERVRQPTENPAREIGGGRMRLDLNLSSDASVFANYGSFYDWQGYTDPEANVVRPGIIHDAYAGGELRWDRARSWAMLTAGWRVVVLESTGNTVRRDGHAELDVTQAITDQLSLSFQGFHMERSKRSSTILDHHFREGTQILELRYRPAFTVSAGYEYTTEAVRSRTHYFNGSIGWELSPASSLRLFAGGQRGGLRCVSGICRVVPPFEGVRLTATLRW